MHGYLWFIDYWCSTVVLLPADFKIFFSLIQCKSQRSTEAKHFCTLPALFSVILFQAVMYDTHPKVSELSLWVCVFMSTQLWVVCLCLSQISFSCKLRWLRRHKPYQNGGILIHWRHCWLLTWDIIELTSYFSLGRFDDWFCLGKLYLN